MRNVRLISRLDIKAPNLVKGVQLEGLRKIGNPRAIAKQYFEEGIDEILYVDIVASLYERNSILELVQDVARDIFIPITVCGGLRSIEDVGAALRSGADKVAINTAAVKRPSIISEVAKRFGSQCMILSIEAQRKNGHWESFYDNGREPSGVDVIQWAKEGQNLGAGEILLTSVDCEGRAQGFDVDLVRAVTDSVDIPVITSGGMGKLEHLQEVVEVGNTDAVAMAHVLHYGILSPNEIRNYCIDYGIRVRSL